LLRFARLLVRRLEFNESFDAAKQTSYKSPILAGAGRSR
jgi:hypothetical protein